MSKLIRGIPRFGCDTTTTVFLNKKRRTSGNLYSIVHAEVVRTPFLGFFDTIQYSIVPYTLSPDAHLKYSTPE